MSGERRFSRAHGPDMEVMNLSHTGALSQIGLNSKPQSPQARHQAQGLQNLSKELPRPTTTTATMIKLTTGSNHNQSVAIMAMPARTTPIPRISGHVQERATDVALRPDMNMRGSGGIDRNPDQCHADDRTASDRLWIAEASDGFQVIAPIERRRNMAFKSAARRNPQPVSVAFRRRATGKRTGPPGKEESQDITQVVTRIGNQSKGVCQVAIPCLNNHKTHIKERADCKGDYNL